MIRAGVVGASGYSGLELLRLLAQHQQVEVAALFGNASAGKKVDDVHPSLRNVLDLGIRQIEDAALSDLDVVFVALPSGQSMTVVPRILDAGCRVVDLGGDFRLTDIAVYKTYYGHDHTAAHLLGEAVYGLTEWNEEAVRDARLVANPGCYPTSIQLALLPLLKEGMLDTNPIGITSYSGTSGAGRSVTESMMFTEVNESVRAYKVVHHQHVPEIRRFLREFSGVDVAFTFVPHLLPVTRGIYTTIHAQLGENFTATDVHDALQKAYAGKPFVRILDTTPPSMGSVQHSNFCDIGYAVHNNLLVLLSSIDNLGKGAAGQAVQNMNVMFGLQQTEGILPCFKTQLSLT